MIDHAMHLINHKGALLKEIAFLETQLKDHDTGHIKYDIVGIKGHGVVSIDTSPWRAYEHIERLEHICKIVLASGKF
jgi:L-fuculose-phosphate aldolase